MATPANFGKLVNFIAALRKPNLIPFGYFSPNDNLGFIASGAAGGGTQITAANPVETPNGIRTTFTFSSPPLFMIYNGQTLEPPNDFTVSGNVATMPVAPESGARLYAYI